MAGYFSNLKVEPNPDPEILLIVFQTSVFYKTKQNNQNPLGGGTMAPWIKGRYKNLVLGAYFR